MRNRLFIFSVLFFISMHGLGQKTGNGGFFTTQQMRTILFKFSEAIQFSFSPNANLFASLSGNTQEIYTLSKNDFEALGTKILIIPSSLRPDGNKKTICLVGLTTSFQEIIDRDSIQYILDNTIDYKSLESDEKSKLFQTLLPARNSNLIPYHCDLEK